MSASYYDDREGYRDARGAPFLPLRRRVLKERGERDGFISIKRYDKIIRSVMARREYVLIIAISGGFAAVLTGLLPTGSPPGSYIVRAVVTGAAGGLAWWGLVHRTIPRSVYYFEQMLAEHWCPACGYQLRNSSHEDDDFHVCSGCRAVWVPAPNCEQDS